METFVFRYAPRWDCGSEYEIRVQLLDGKSNPMKTFAPRQIYFEQWSDPKWHQVRARDAKAEGDSGLTDPCLPDNPRVPELRAGSQIHPLHPRRQGHAVLGGLVRDPCHRQLS